MLDAGGGSIVSVASIAASVCVGGAAYAASKGGILSYTRHVSRELAARGVRVNCVSPGFMRTPMTTGERDGFDADAQAATARGVRQPRPDAARSAAPTTSPTPCCSSPATSRAYVTGQELVVDGGYLVR